MDPLLPIEYVLLLGTVLLAASGYLAWTSAADCPARARWLVLASRLLGLSGVVLIALNPGRWHIEQRAQTTEWAMLLDTSRSMGTADVRGQSRWRETCRLVRQLLADQPQRRFRLFTFDNKLRALESARKLADITSTGETTDILGACDSALQLGQSGGSRLAGIILLSDGRQVEPGSLDEFALKARALQTPVYPVVIGSKTDLPDLEIVADRRQFIAFKGQPLKLTAIVRQRNLDRVTPTVRLLDAEGRVLAERKVELGGRPSASVEFELVPDRLGYSDYTFKVDPWPGETALANNTCRLGVCVLESKLRVLLAEGMPYWDSKFIAQLLQKQKHLQLTTVYRLSASKYFRIEQGDDAPGDAVQGVFPETAADFARYDVILFGKGVEYFLTPEKTQLLAQFVRDRGGGVLFARGKPYNNRLPELESLEPAEWGAPREGAFRWQPTVGGEETGLFGGDLPGRNDPVWEKLPALVRASECARLKAFTQVLAEGVSGTGEQARRFPVVLSQRYGKGLVVAVNADGLWQWDFFPSFEGASKLYRGLWSQLLQWLVTYSEFLPGQDYSLRLSDTVVRADQPVIARVSSRAPDAARLQPLLRVLDGNTVVQETVPSLAVDAAGRWEGILALRKPGTYRVELSVGSKGFKLYETLQIRSPLAESDDASVDAEFMAKLAAQTGGIVITADNVNALFQHAATPPLAARGENAQWKPLWDRGLVLTVILCCFGGEWFIRRRNGLI